MPATLTTAETHAPVAGVRELCMLLDREGLPSFPAGPQGWDDTADLALRHRLGPEIFARIVLRKAAVELREPYPRLLRQQFLQTAFTAQKICEDVRAVLALFARDGIQVIALKGLHLVYGGYAEPALRPMGDIDLLVRPDQVWKAWTALREDGFVAREDIREDQVALFPLHLPGLSKPRTIPVELHRAITSPLLPARIPVEGLWERSRPLTIGPHTISALSPEDLLLHLCMHATHQHRCQVPLRSIYDIALVVDRTPDGIAWEALLRIARSSGTERPLYCGLALAEQVFGAAVPGEVLRSLVPDEDRAGILSWALDTVLHFDTPAGPLARYRTGPGMLPRRIARAARELFSSPRIIASTTRRGSLLSRLGAYWRLVLKVAARDREFAARLANGDPGAHGEVRAARTVAAIEDWMAK